MRLDLDEAELAFRAEVRAFLADALTDVLRQAARASAWVDVDIGPARQWHRALHHKGWVAPSWPKEHGGAAWTPRQRYIFEYECAIAGAPPIFSVPMGVGTLGPALIRYGTEAQQRRYLPRILSGEDWWCQGYSEPNAGSDLASLQCKAIPDGEDYVVTGAKIWTSHAQVSNRMFALVRTSREDRPQRGITFVLLDLTARGVTIRPIRTLAGGAHINEVVLDGVRVPKSERVGEEGEGWSVAKYVLEFERGHAYLYGPRLRASLETLRPHVPHGHVCRARLVLLDIELAALEAIEFAAASAATRAEAPGPGSSLAKLMGTRVQQDLSELWMDRFGAAALRAPADMENGTPSDAQIALAGYLNSRAASIYSGSDEIQRNVYAKRVLGL